MMKLKSYAAKSVQGPFLNLNEDAVEVDVINKLYMIFDGFGGLGVGDKVVRDLVSNIKRFYLRFGDDPDSTLPFYFSKKYLIEGNAVINAFRFAHDNLVRENKEKEMNDRGGASGIAAAQAENILSICHVGNCKGFLIRRLEVHEVLSPDSMELMTKESVRPELSTAPMSGFGLFDEIHLNLKEIRISSGDTFIFLTDGAYSRLKLNELKYIIENKNSDTEKLNEIFSVCNKRGNHDNQSGMILRY